MTHETNGGRTPGFECPDVIGVDLLISSERLFLGRPLIAGGHPRRAPDPALLDLVPVALLERSGRAMRQVWRTRGATALLWLYVDPLSGQWHPYCPPQRCNDAVVAIDLAAVAAPPPFPAYWLAGSVLSVPSCGEDTATATALLASPSPHEGVHFVLDCSRPLAAYSCYLRNVAPAGVRPVPLHLVCDDPPDHGALSLLE